MPSSSDKLEALLRERADIRLSVSSFQKAMQRTVFAFITILVGVAAIYWDERAFPNPDAKTFMLFFLSQIEVFLGFFVISQFSVQTSATGYIQALELKINTLLNDKITLYESQIVDRFLSHPRASHFWSMACVILFAFLCFVFFVWAAFEQMNSFWYGVITTCECLVLMSLTVLAIVDIKRVRKHAMDVFGLQDK